MDFFGVGSPHLLLTTGFVAASFHLDFLLEQQLCHQFYRCECDAATAIHPETCLLSSRQAAEQNCFAMRTIASASFLQVPHGAREGRGCQWNT